MAWVISFDSGVERDLKKLDKSVQKRIINYLKRRISESQDPRKYGKPLRGKLSGLWRYRLGDYRILCRIIDNEAIVLVIKISHRRHVYK